MGDCHGLPSLLSLPSYAHTRHKRDNGGARELPVSYCKRYAEGGAASFPTFIMSPLLWLNMCVLCSCSCCCMSPTQLRNVQSIPLPPLMASIQYPKTTMLCVCVCAFYSLSNLLSSSPLTQHIASTIHISPIALIWLEFPCSTSAACLPACLSYSYTISPRHLLHALKPIHRRWRTRDDDDDRRSGATMRIPYRYAALLLLLLLLRTFREAHDRLQAAAAIPIISPATACTAIKHLDKIPSSTHRIALHCPRLRWIPSTQFLLRQTLPITNQCN